EKSGKNADSIINKADKRRKKDQFTSLIVKDPTKKGKKKTLSSKIDMLYGVKEVEEDGYVSEVRIPLLVYSKTRGVSKKIINAALIEAYSQGQELDEPVIQQLDQNYFQRSPQTNRFKGSPQKTNRR